jgi:hypothetical protein
MPDVQERLKDLEREVKEASAAQRASAEEPPRNVRHKRPIRRRTKQKILVAVALVVAFLLVWKKVNIHFVVFTSFWGFLGILAAVFAIIYLVLRFIFEETDS